MSNSSSFVGFWIMCIVLASLPLCVFWCRAKRRRQHLLSQAPVVVVSEHHTNAGPYPVTVQHHNANMTATAGAPGAYPMPPQHQGMPMPGNYGPYAGQAVNAPYPTNTPYPMGGGMPQPGVGGMPMPQNPAMMNPPSYNEVVGNEAYQKQAPYNPNYSS